MKRKKYLLLAGCSLLVAFIASTSLAATPCEDAFTNVGSQCTSASPPVLNYIKNFIPELYKGPYVMWWVERLMNPAQDWEVASNKFFDSLPGAAQPQGTIFEQNVPVPMNNLFAYDNTVNAGMHTIYFGNNYDSYLMVPVVPPQKGQEIND